MFIAAARRGCHGFESIEDQVPADVGDVIQTSKPDPVARGIAINLLQMAKRIGPCMKLLNTKIYPGRKTSPWTVSLKMIEGAIILYRNGTVELSMKAPISVPKPADLE